MFCIVLNELKPHWRQIWGRPMRSSTNGLGSVSWFPAFQVCHLHWVPALQTRLCRTDLRGLDLRASEESHDGSQEFRYCFGIQAIYLFSSCYLEGATIDVLMGPHILCQAENDLNDSFSEWIMENSVSKSPKCDCLASALFLLLMFSLFTQIVTETDSHFFFYFKNSESVIRRELWHFPVKWFDSPTVISSVISSSVISAMSSSQASCLVPVCLNEILPADEAIANKKNACPHSPLGSRKFFILINQT